MIKEELEKEAEMYTEEYYFETPVQFFMAGADIGSRETKKELERIKFRLEYANAIIKDLLDNSDEYVRQRAMDFLETKE